jgi:hypothetical protein
VLIKNFYNEASASKLGWDPSWFGEDEFDDELVQAIEKLPDEARFGSRWSMWANDLQKSFDRKRSPGSHGPKQVSVPHRTRR